MDLKPRVKIDKDYERLRVAHIVGKVSTGRFSIELCEWACHALASITALAMINQDGELLVDCLGDGACETIQTSFSKFGTVSPVIAAYGCQAVCCMSYASNELKEFLGEIGMCELVVFVTSMHIGDPEVSEHGSCAIGLLAANNITNSLRLALAGACDCMIQTGNFGFNIRHERSNIVASNVCYAIAYLCEASNAGQLLECGAGELVTQLLKIHFQSESLASSAVKALCGLSSLNFDHREALGRCGTCELIISVLGRYNRVSIVQEVCETVMHLSLSPGNAAKLGNAGACEAVVEALQGALLDNPCGPEVCTGALVNLIIYGSTALENRNKLLKAGVADLLRKVQLSSKVSYKARENILQIFDYLCPPAPLGGSNYNNSYINSPLAAEQDYSSVSVSGIGNSLSRLWSDRTRTVSLAANTATVTGTGSSAAVLPASPASALATGSHRATATAAPSPSPMMRGVVVLASAVTADTRPLSVEITACYEDIADINDKTPHHRHPEMNSYDNDKINNNSSNMINIHSLDDDSTQDNDTVTNTTSSEQEYGNSDLHFIASHATRSAEGVLEL